MAPQTQTNTAAATNVLIKKIRIRRGCAGALSGVPGTTRPSSACVRMPNGSTANSTVHQMMKYRAMPKVRLMAVLAFVRECPGPLRLLQFNKCTAEILWMQKKNGLAVRADLGLPVAKHSCALRHQAVARGLNIVDLVADVVDAAVDIALKKLCDGRRRPQRREQLDFGVRQRDKDNRNAVFDLSHRLRNLGPEC